MYGWQAGDTHPTGMLSWYYIGTNLTRLLMSVQCDFLDHYRSELGHQNSILHQMWIPYPNTLWNDETWTQSLNMKMITFFGLDLPAHTRE